MYSGGYSVGVKLEGAILKELKNGVIPFPFDKEYQLHLVNNTKRDCIAKVYIDDENVTQGGLILRASQTIDLERPTDSFKRNRFKFVPLGSEEAAKAGKTDNSEGDKGTIKVEFYPAVQRETEQHQHHHHHYYYPPLPPPITITPTWYPINPWPSPYKTPFIPTICRSSIKSEEVNISYNSTTSVPSVSQRQLSEGCTVPGSLSNQNFTSSYLEVEKTPTTILLTLKGYYVESFYCDNCGIKLPKSVRYCSNCGTQVKANHGEVKEVR